ncbi:MFS transporter [Ornithinimicrobium sp. Y1694]|uniref:MFS transporter n=1 Tax=Ornithinimicrobium sp. Y1694 TaxID=3418590 RepID=UPI003CE6C6EA
MSARSALIDLAPLRQSQPYRRFWVGGLLAGLGAQIAVVAVLFQVWEQTRNPYWVGAIGLVQAVPMIVMGLIGGPVADVLDRRTVALWSTAGQTVAALTLAAQLVVGLYPLPMLLTVLAAQTACAALGAPARRTFTVRLLPRHLVAGGIALHMISFQAAMLVGPALGGLLIGATSVAVCYLINALALLISCWSVWVLPAMPPERGPATTPGTADTSRRPPLTRVWRRTRTALSLLGEGVTQVTRNPVLRGSFLLDLAATLLAFPIALFPMVNQELFGGDPRTLGLFMTAVAVGGVSAGLASGLVTRARHLGRVQLLAVGIWGIALLGFGLAALAGIAWGALLALVVAGAADTASVTSRAAMVQLATPDHTLGRVTAVEHVIGVAGPDIGNARAGFVAGLTTPAWSALLGAGACLVISAWVALTHRPIADFVVDEP